MSTTPSTASAKKPTAKPKAPAAAKPAPKAKAKPAAKTPAKPAPKAKPVAKAMAKPASGREAMLARVESVRLSQRTEGHFDCFGRAAQGYCDQGGCSYHVECLSISRMLHEV